MGTRLRLNTFMTFEPKHNKRMNHSISLIPRKMARFLSLIILPMLTILPFSYASPQLMLSTGSSLLVEEYRQTFLVSPNGDFSCGFYEVGRNAFSFSIWFTNTVFFDNKEL